MDPVATLKQAMIELIENDDAGEAAYLLSCFWEWVVRGGVASCDLQDWAICLMAAVNHKMH